MVSPTAAAFALALTLASLLAAVAVVALQTEAAGREGAQVEGQTGLGGRALARGGACAVRVRLEPGRQVVHGERLPQLGVHQGQPGHLQQGVTAVTPGWCPVEPVRKKEMCYGVLYTLLLVRQEEFVLPQRGAGGGRQLEVVRLERCEAVQLVK